MPTTVLAFEMDSFDKAESMDDRAEAVFRLVDPQVRRRACKGGAFPFPADKVEALGEPYRGQAKRLMRWGVSSAWEIALQRHQLRNYGYQSVGDWRMGGDYSMLLGAIGADYVLFVVVRELDESAGRALLGFASGTVTRFRDVAVACVADLLRKRMVWCNVKADYRGDLTEPEDARIIMGKLLEEF
jgi:hypothetical protein